MPTWADDRARLSLVFRQAGRDSGIGCGRGHEASDAGVRLQQHLDALAQGHVFPTGLIQISRLLVGRSDVQSSGEDLQLVHRPGLPGVSSDFSAKSGRKT
jgi:hypothetical protein